MAAILNSESTTLSPAAFAEKYKVQLEASLSHIDYQQLALAAQLLEQARDRDNQIFVCGNGGSAATASHFVTDMVKGASHASNKRFRILALTDSLSTMTAYSNDICYECVFTEQLKNFARPADIFIAISGSGNSPNVLHAMTYANEMGCHTIALTGRDGGKLGPMANLELRAHNSHMGRIEDIHMVMCHMLCYFFIDQRVSNNVSVMPAD